MKIACSLVLVNFYVVIAGGFSANDVYDHRDLDTSHMMMMKRPGPQKMKTGPTAGSWYYIMGHPSGDKRLPPEDKRSSVQSRNIESRPSIYQPGNTYQKLTAKNNLFQEFVEYLSLKRRGLLDVCLRRR